MDYTCNNNPTAVLEAIDHLVDLGKLPDFVAETKIPTPEQLEGLSKTAFADTESREYPIFNKGSVFFSIADFHGSGKCDGNTYERIKTAAAVNGLSEINEILEQYFEDKQEKDFPASDTLTKYAFQFDGKSYYPINSAEEVERSAVSFMNVKNNLPVTTVHEIAQELVKAAAEFDVTAFLPDVVVSMGQKRVFDEDFLISQIEFRKSACEKQEDIEIYDEIVKSAAEIEDHTELIVTLEEFDRQVLPQSFRDHGFFKNAYEAFRSGPLEENVDAAISEFIYFNEEDVLVPRSAFTKIASDTLDVRFSKEVADKAKEVVKLASEDTFAATAVVNGMEKWARKELLKILVSSN